jgi:hypothetical protein
MSLDNVNSAFSAALYKKLQKQINPLSEKLNELAEVTHLIETTPGPMGIKGDKGVKGDKGIKGDKGERGIQGPIGLTGLQGTQGVKGDAGVKGEQGIEGNKGDAGAPGVRGEKGDIGLRGEVGPRGEQGIQGEVGPQGIQGPKGDIGKKGDVGAQGVSGLPGLKGDIGSQGLQGLTGDAGPQGVKGDKGDTGAKGDKGDKGDKGQDAEIPDVNNIIDPLFNKAKSELDSFIASTDKTFKSWKNAVNNQVSQVSSISSGGEVWLSRLNDVQSSTAKVDGQFLKYDASQKKWVGGTVDLNSLVGAAPETLDTLVELAAAINNDEDFATTIADNIATKVDQTDLDTHTSNTNNPHSVTAAQVGLGNVTDESKATMFTNPVFTGTISSSGLLDFGHRTSDATIIRAESDSHDITLIRAASNSDAVGVSLKYIGSGNGDENIFEIATDGGGSFKIDNSGDVGINTAPIDGIDLAVGTFTASGNVGIGTTSPSEKLEVNGDLMLQQNGVIKNLNNNTQFRFGVNDLYLDAGHLRAEYSVGIRGNRGSTKGMEQGSTLNSDLGINCGGNEAISIHSDGDTLINNALEVEGTTTVGKITLSDNSFVVESSSFTLGSTHRGATVLLQNTGAITITVPQLTAGHTTTFIAETSNSVVFASGAGLSAFNSFNSANQIAGIFGQAQIIFKSSTEAFLGGNVV